VQCLPWQFLLVHSMLNMQSLEQLQWLTYIQLVDGYYGNRTSVTTQLPHKHKLVDVPQDAGLVLQVNQQEWNRQTVSMKLDAQWAAFPTEPDYPQNYSKNSDSAGRVFSTSSFTRFSYCPLVHLHEQSDTCNSLHSAEVWGALTSFCVSTARCTTVLSSLQTRYAFEVLPP